MPVRLPIHFLNDQLQAVERPHEGRPLVQIGIIGTHVSTGSDVHFSQYWALVDTGADLNYAEASFLDSLQAPRTGIGEIIGATSRTHSHRRSMTLIPGPVSDCTAVKTDVMELDSSRHDAAKPYQVILGNLFLERGVLHMDHVQREYWFDYIGG